MTVLPLTITKIKHTKMSNQHKTSKGDPFYLKNGFTCEDCNKLLRCTGNEMTRCEMIFKEKFQNHLWVIFSYSP